MASRSSIFDMIGPVMIGPSSSHTAGVVRIGRVARRLLGGQPTHATITFYNSFAATYEGHGSDRAALAGLLDCKTDDPRVKEGRTLAEEQGLGYTLRAVASASKLHPNSIRIHATDGTHETELLAISRGGGLISVKEVEGYECNFTAQQHTLLFSAQDTPGSVGYLASVLAREEANIATLTVARNARAGDAKLVFELDSGLRPLTLEYLRSLPWVQRVVYIPDIDL